ncbi:15073_t:CDS:10 [Entrophospora sp. SA101]|nr:15073_t:CDS:10 [Entrophospora sp. SA101]CAJ0846121.1 7823_t:CDS:10 [Entrophospora sp. SA101]
MDYNKKRMADIDPVYDSDSSTENAINTVGNIPMEWYDDYPHIGYDIGGEKIMKPARGDELDNFLDNMEDPDTWLSVKDVLSQQDVKLTDEELEIIRRIQMGEFPDPNYDPYEPTVEWFTSKPEIMPLSATPEPKRRFIPSKWEAKRIMKIVRAIRQGRIVPGKTPVQKPRFYDLWNDNDKPREDHPMHLPAPKTQLPEHDESYNPPAEYLLSEKERENWNNTDADDREKNYMPQKKRSPSPDENRYYESSTSSIATILRAIRQGRIVPGKTPVQKPRFYDLWNDNDKPREDHPMHLPAPKTQLPEHDESYNPPAEYLLSEKERENWNNTDADDREKNYMPQKYQNLRSVPSYNRFIQERFNRCLDLYLAPRMRRNKLNIDPESLIPKLPNPKDLQPFPKSLTISYDAHTGYVRTFSIDPTGLWMVSGSDDKTVRIWEIITGRCVKIWHLEDVVHSVAWCPNKDIKCLAVSYTSKILIISPTDIFDKETTEFTVKSIILGFDSLQQNDEKRNIVEWIKPAEKNHNKEFLAIIHHSHNKTIKQINWHRKGDYFFSVAPDAGNQGVIIHHLSKHQSQQPFQKIKGIVQCASFHPIKPLFLIATQRFVRVYDLLKQELIKSLQSDSKWISSLDIHPMGDNLIVGSYDKRLCWFHSKAIRNVTFHKRLPLFASCSDDGNIQIFHGMVYNDLLQNPLIVPVKILKNGHQTVNNLGVLCCEFHPTQPWIISSGADHSLKLWS